MQLWLYEKATGLFVYGGGGDVEPHDPQLFGVVELEGPPDPLLDRFDPVNGKRLATAQELAAEIDRQKSAQADLELGKLAIQSLGKVLLDRLDQAVVVLNQCRTEALHTQRPPVQAINRTQFWADVKDHFKELLP